MLKVQQKSAPSTDKTDRRRGRPAGKNRTPLSLEERRARNAQYERERRNETADAMAHLAEAAGCDPQIANAELLATVISQFQRRAKRKVPEDIDNLRRINENLESQIADLQRRLGQDIQFNSTGEDLIDYEPDEPSNNYESYYQRDELEVPTKSKSQSKGKTNIQKGQKEMQRSKKIRKTSKSSSVREKQDESDSDTQSDSSSTSNWSANVRTAPTQYQLRNRSQKVSEHSTTSTHRTIEHRTSESSQYGTASEQSCSNSNPFGARSQGTSPKYDSEDSSQSDSENPENMIEPHLATVPDLDEDDLEQFDKQMESAELNELTEGETLMINQWLDGNETLKDQSDHEVDNKVLNFLDFKDFMFEINA